MQNHPISQCGWHQMFAFRFPVKWACLLVPHHWRSVGETSAARNVAAWFNCLLLPSWFITLWLSQTWSGRSPDTSSTVLHRTEERRAGWLDRPFTRLKWPPCQPVQSLHIRPQWGRNGAFELSRRHSCASSVSSSWQLSADISSSKPAAFCSDTTYGTLRDTINLISVCSWKLANRSYSYKICVLHCCARNIILWSSFPANLNLHEGCFFGPNYQNTLTFTTHNNLIWFIQLSSNYKNGDLIIAHGSEPNIINLSSTWFLFL